MDATCLDLTAFQFHVGVKGPQKQDLLTYSVVKKRENKEGGPPDLDLLVQHATMHPRDSSCLFSFCLFVFF